MSSLLKNNEIYDNYIIMKKIVKSYLLSAPSRLFLGIRTVLGYGSRNDCCMQGELAPLEGSQESLIPTIRRYFPSGIGSG